MVDKNVEIIGGSFRPDPTESYRLENEYVHSLRRIDLRDSAPQSGIRKMLPRMAIPLIRSIKSIVDYILKDLIIHNKRLRIIVSLKNTKTIKNALLVGNGPSQGFLNFEFLKKFKDENGDVFVVNYWHLNERFAQFVPTYIVISDPGTLSFSPFHAYREDKNRTLLDYLKLNGEIKILCPFDRCQEISRLLGEDRVIGFVDREVGSWMPSIKPIYPRGYLSMTLYKALSLALWFGYKNIYVIGMDNTYPRNVYCDKNNFILNLETHAGDKDFVVDQSSLYPSMAALMKELARLFGDARRFAKNDTVRNLDQYSLTDAFPKVDMLDVFKHR